MRAKLVAVKYKKPSSCEAIIAINVLKTRCSGIRSVLKFPAISIKKNLFVRPTTVIIIFKDTLEK